MSMARCGPLTAAAAATRVAACVFAVLLARAPAWADPPDAPPSAVAAAPAIADPAVAQEGQVSSAAEASRPTAPAGADAPVPAETGAARAPAEASVTSAVTSEQPAEPAPPPGAPPAPAVTVETSSVPPAGSGAPVLAPVPDAQVEPMSPTSPAPPPAATTGAATAPPADAPDTSPTAPAVVAEPGAAAPAAAEPGTAAPAVEAPAASMPAAVEPAVIAPPPAPPARAAPHAMPAARAATRPPIAATAAPAGASRADAALLAAHAAYVDGDADRIATLAPQLAGSMLEPYLAYWQASARLRGPNPDDSAVRPFLSRYIGTVLADRLRAEWLVVLAVKGDFATFDAERRRLVIGGDDAQLSCYTLLARYSLDDGHRREAIGREARRTLSLVSDPGGDGCTALAERLLDDGVLSIWPRLQALMERNQFSAAEKAALRLPPADAAAVKALMAKPAAWLDAANPRLDQMPHALPLLAIVALARDAPERAALYADHLDASFTPEERAIVWGRIGRSGELGLAPDAHAWFERGGELVGLGLDYVRSNDVLENRVRAALRRGANTPAFGLGVAVAPAALAQTISAPIAADQGPAVAGDGPDWAAVRKGIAHMSAEQQAESTWIYWNAQAAIALGQADEGHAALQSIADRFSFYGRLAAEQLQLPAHLPARPEAPAESVIEQLSLRPGFGRARKLFELGLRDEGNREWNWELRGMDDAYLHAAAELARRIGVLDRMIASSERTRLLVDISQRYPMPYREFMTATAAPLGVDAAWIYGLIRQESRFMEDIHSNAGAIGLMQLMPSTARFVARRIGFEHYRADRIGEVNVNLRLGTEYLKLVSDDQDGQPMLASAAYNAGPNRVRKWRAALARPLDGAIFAETIPIGETRDYVKKVLFNTVVYGAMLERPAVSLHALLPAVSPRSVPANDLP